MLLQYNYILKNIFLSQFLTKTWIASLEFGYKNKEENSSIYSQIMASFSSFFFFLSMGGTYPFSLFSG